MEKETKIVLAINGEKALYLFKRESPGYTTVEFVVGWIIGSPAIGDYVDGWASGKYFTKLADAVGYLNKII